MKQNLSRVARALVQAELVRMYGERLEDGQPLPSVTVDQIVEHYGLEWGAYEYQRSDDGGDTWRAESPNRAKQLIRNALNEQYRDGGVYKARRNGKTVRDGKSVVFFTPLLGNWHFWARGMNPVIQGVEERKKTSAVEAA